RYLKLSGLEAVLAESSPWARIRPRVWLCHNSRGNITHTLIPERGVLGGAVLPFQTLNEKWKIIASKKDPAATFLASFGLSPEESEEVIAAVGVARSRVK